MDFTIAKQHIHMKHEKMLQPGQKGIVLRLQFMCMFYFIMKDCTTLYYTYMKWYFLNGVLIYLHGM